MPMLPLFWRIAPYLGAVLIAGAAVGYIDHRGYQRAETEALARENERKLDLAAFEKALGLKVGKLEEAMQFAINESDARVVGTINQLEVTNRTVIQPTLMKEIRSETRFTDPSTGISDGMRVQLNRARSFSEQRPCAASSNAVACFSLPDTEPTPGQ